MAEKKKVTEWFIFSLPGARICVVHSFFSSFMNVIWAESNIQAEAEEMFVYLLIFPTTALSENYRWWHNSTDVRWNFPASSCLATCRCTGTWNFSSVFAGLFWFLSSGLKRIVQLIPMIHRSMYRLPVEVLASLQQLLSLLTVMVKSMLLVLLEPDQLMQLIRQLTSL